MKTIVKILLALIGAAVTVAALLAIALWLELREPPLTGAAHRDQLAVGALTRTFSFYVPAAHADAKPALIFVLHGSGGSGDFMRRFSMFRFDELADQRGAVIVYPDGYKRYWNDCRGSATYAANTEHIDDPAFFAAMIDYFVAKYRVDPQRVYATGISNGGHMAYRLGLEMPQRFAALAAAAANLPIDANLDCKRSGRAVSMAILNGTEDPINPYEGGLVTINGDSSRGTVRSAAETVQYWAGLADATLSEAGRLPETDGNPATWIERKIYRGRDDIEVRLYTLHGSGHVWPTKTGPLMTKILQPLGGPAGDVEATNELWEFFDAHRAALPTAAAAQ